MKGKNQEQKNRLMEVIEIALFIIGIDLLIAGSMTYIPYTSSANDYKNIMTFTFLQNVIVITKLIISLILTTIPIALGIIVWNKKTLNNEEEHSRWENSKDKIKYALIIAIIVSIAETIACFLSFTILRIANDIDIKLYIGVLVLTFAMIFNAMSPMDKAIEVKNQD